MIDEPDRADELQAIAERHGVSFDAVRHLTRALRAGHGSMAQFDHPDLGGFGQWSAGGMTMIGQMFDSGLKARVAALCAELAATLPAEDWAGTPSGAWWPAELGQPASSGAQNAMRYAHFPQSRRLAVETDGTLALYDTGDHDIGGVSQAQGGGQSLRFTGRGGAVELEALKRVDGPPATAEPDYPELQAHSRPEPAPASRAQRNASPAGDDVLSTLERLSDLHRKGVLTEAEFSAKKAELLARL